MLFVRANPWHPKTISLCIYSKTKITWKKWVVIMFSLSLWFNLENRAHTRSTSKYNASAHVLEGHMYKWCASSKAHAQTCTLSRGHQSLLPGILWHPQQLGPKGSVFGVWFSFKFYSWPWDQWLLVLAVILHTALIPLKDLPLEEASSYLIASVTVFTKMEKLHVADPHCPLIRLKQINHISVMDVMENQLP